MLIVEIKEKELTGGHTKIMLIRKIAKIVLTGSHIGIMLFIENKKKNKPAVILELCYLQRITKEN